MLKASYEDLIHIHYPFQKLISHPQWTQKSTTKLINISKRIRTNHKIRRYKVLHLSWRICMKGTWKQNMWVVHPQAHPKFSRACMSARSTSIPAVKTVICGFINLGRSWKNIICVTVMYYICTGTFNMITRLVYPVFQFRHLIFRHRFLLE